jgi:ubiquinone/menaquinone biosynthesis C-methylase UbiE
MALLDSITRANRRLNRWFFPGERVRYVRRFRELACDLSREGALVLHLGSGAVDLGSDLEKRGKRTATVNLDLDLEGLKKNPGARKVCTNAGELPFSEDRFDAICSEHVFEHFAEPERILAECFRVLKPGGSLVVSGPNGMSYIALAARITSLEFHDSVRHLNRDGNEEPSEGFHTFYRVSTPRTIRRLARQSGFELRAVERFVGEPCYTTFLPALHLLFILFHLVLEKLSPLLGFHITAIAVLRKPLRRAAAGVPRLPTEENRLTIGAR